MISESFNSDIEVLEVRYTGLVTLDEIKDHLLRVNNNETYPRRLNVISYTTEATFDVTPDNPMDVAKINFSLPRKYEHIKTAVLTDDPNQTSLILLFQHLANSKHYEIKTFVLEENALRWLDSK